TAVHNTVMVAGEEINPIASERLFELAPYAHPRVEAFDRTGESVRLVASHDGYRRLEPAVGHRRAFTLDAIAPARTVEDELSGAGTQAAEAVLQLAPGTTVTRTGVNGFELTRRGTTITVAFAGVESVQSDTGWVLDSFGTRKPAPRLRARVEGILPLRFVCRLAPVRK